VNTRISYPRWTGVLLSFAIGLAIGGVGIVKLRTEVQRGRYELARIEKLTRELKLAVDQLERTEQTLASPGRIQELARARGFIEVTPRDRIVLEPVLARAHPRAPRNNR